MASDRERREAIRRATEDARQRAIARREAIAAQTAEIYNGLAEELQAWLEEHAGADGRVTPERLAEFEAFLAALLERARARWSQLLGDGLAESAALAALVLPAGMGNGTIVQQTLQQLSDFVGADGLQLSDRIWRVNEGTRRAIADTLRGAILRGESAWQAAQGLLASGAAVPPATVAAAQGARASALAAAAAGALMRDQGNPLRNALRVTRTEINRAFTESFVASAFAHPDTAGVKFNLSPLHPRPDICDLYAKANLHGLGVGVYPRGAHPYPAHPETLSFLTVVFEDEITPEDRAGQQTPFEWLRGASAEDQVGVLGVNKAAEFQAGRLLDGELLAPWREVRMRIYGE